MPKIVDHEQRKTVIAEAAWRVILNEGIQGATVRSIAKEAGLSLGALRHYFSSQDELLAYAMNLVKERASARVNEILQQELAPKEKVLLILLELVPINETTMAEMEVWFAFTFHNRHKADEFDAQHDGIYDGVGRLIAYMEQHGLLRKETDAELETERLYALIDGVAMHALLEPHRVNRERIIRVFKHHLDSICI